MHSILKRAQQGDPEALNRLLVEMQAELRRIVRSSRKQRLGLSMRTTELFNETFLKMFRRSVPGFNDQEHLLAMWTQATSWVIIEAWRRKGRRPELDALVEETMLLDVSDSESSPEAVRLAFDALKDAMPREGLAAEMRLISGLSTKDIAGLLNVSEPTVRRWVRAASAWIRMHIATGEVAGTAHEDSE